MSYILKYTKQAERHFEKHRKSGTKKMMIKIHQILNELRESILSQESANLNN